MGIGDWGLGIGDWGLGIGPNPQSPIPNPQSPIPMIKIFFLIYYIKNKNIKIFIIYNKQNFLNFIIYIFIFLIYFCNNYQEKHFRCLCLHYNIYLSYHYIYYYNYLDLELYYY